MKVEEDGGLYTPANEFQIVPGYKNRAMSPAVVSQETGNILSLYFNNDPRFDPRLGKQYLATDTLNYIWEAEKGFYTLYDKKSKIGKQELVVFLDESETALAHPDIESNEAFGHSMVVFSVLPEIAQHPSYPKGFSKRNILRPPETTMEFLLRLKELRVEIIKIIGGQTSPQTPMETNNSLLRSYLYFWVARKIPLRCSENKREIEEKARVFINKLLGDIKIFLD